MVDRCPEDIGLLWCPPPPPGAKHQMSRHPPVVKQRLATLAHVLPSYHDQGVTLGQLELIWEY